MKLELITPSADLVSLDEAKQQLRVDHDNDDDLITLYIKAAQQRLDGPNGILGLAVGVQTWRVSLDAFPDDPYVLPILPFSEIVSVSYVDDLDATIIMDSADYYIDLLGNLRPTVEWPTSSQVFIEYKAGSTRVSHQAKIAMLLIIGHFYRNRESTTTESMKELPMGVYDFVSNIRSVYL